MSKVLMSMAAALACMTASQALAQEKPAQPKEKMICRTEPPTGTRIQRNRICAPQRVWDQIREEHLQSNEHRKVDAEKSRPFRL